MRRSKIKRFKFILKRSVHSTIIFPYESLIHKLVELGILLNGPDWIADQNQMSIFRMRLLATADPCLILLTDFESISGPRVSLRETLAKCDSGGHRSFRSMIFGMHTVNYIPDRLKIGISFKIILKVYLGLIAN